MGVAMIALMVEAGRSSKISVRFYQITQRNKPENSQLQ
jgi:hypothetical protein